VFVIDTSSDAVVATIPDLSGTGVAVAPDGRHVYVTLPPGDRVAVIATNTNSLVTTIPTWAAEPSRVVVSPDGRRVYVTNRGSKLVSVVRGT
jgi:YVTN family beta-propeller protein